MHESIEAFTSGEAQLVGILHTSDSPHLAANNPTVLMWNVGIAHRIGPQRQYVELARKLARMNFPAFRFDLSGMGDSDAAVGGLGRQEQEVMDIRRAMDHLAARYGHKQFILLGFCSSAANAHPTALQDERVRGLIMIDSYGYRTLRYLLLHYIMRLFSPANWRSRLSSLRQKWRRDEGVPVSYFSDFPPRRTVVAELNTMIDRGVRMLFVYSAGVQHYFNHVTQFWAMLPGLKRAAGLIDVTYFPRANHLFTYQDQKNEYINLVCEWINQHFITSGQRGPSCTAYGKIPQ